MPPKNGNWQYPFVNVFKAFPATRVGDVAEELDKARRTVLMRSVSPSTTSNALGTLYSSTLLTFQCV